MDQNKLQKLKEIDYKIYECCGMCSSFRPGQKEFFGTCTTHMYDHLKHDVKERELSVTVYGHCKSFRIRSICEIILGFYIQFVKKEKL